MSEAIRRPPLPEPAASSMTADPRDRQEGRLLRCSLGAAVMAHALLLPLPIPTSTVDAAVEPPMRPIVKIVNVRPKPPVPPTPVDPPIQPRQPMATIPVPELAPPEPLPFDDPLPAPDPVADDVGADRFTPILTAPPPPPPEDGPVYVIGNVEPPTAIDAPKPRYPDFARQVGRNGLVVLQAVIGRDGLVREVQVLRGAPFGMTEAAVEAVRSWRFHPATRDDEPVAVYYQLTVRFQQVR